MRSVSILRVFFSIYLFCCVLFAALSWKDLVENESLSLRVLEFSFYGILGLLLDFVFNIFVRNKKDKKDKKVLSVAIIIVFSYFLLTKLNII